MKRHLQAFTFAEVLITVTLLVLVLTAALTVYIWQQRAWQATELNIEAAHAANMALNRMIYGAGERRGLRAAQTITLTSFGDDWELNYTTPTENNRVEYNASEQRLVFQPGGREIGREITSASATRINDFVWTFEVTAQRERGRNRASFTAETEVRRRN